MIKRIEKNGEIHLSVGNREGITVGDLHAILTMAIQNNPEFATKPVALCLPQIETGETLIASACNEGDDSVFWLSLDRRSTNMAVKGFERRWSS